MATPELLREAVAEFLKVDAATLTADYSLRGGRLEGSIGRAALDAALRRRLGISCEAVYSAGSYGELEGAVLGTATAAPAPAAPQPAGPATPVAPAGLACGLDLELIENLPDAADFWEDEFYRQSFTSAEIAYCAKQANPRLHFAARWCAKEALRKCDPAFARVPFAAIELAQGEGGAIFLRHAGNGTAGPLPYAVSVSHTAVAAAAVVVRAELPRPAPPPQPAAAPAGPPTTGRSLVPVLTLLLALAAAALAVWALLRTF
jgi:holo-[acyl-carrier protein] synthase